MAFVRLLCTASKLNKLKQQLIEEKEDAVKISQDLPAKKKKIRHYVIDLRLKINNCFEKIWKFPEHSVIHRICYNVRHDGSCENFLLKSILGFISGFLLTYIFFMFFVIQLNFKLSTATIMCSVLGSVLTLGLAFSYKIRCIVLLTLPQFFSKKGRQALLAYAFILAITGPAKNTLNNMSILSESLACGQEQLKSAVRQIIDVIKKPFLAIKEAIKKIVKTVKEIVKKIKEILLKIKRIIMAIIKVIKAAFEFLGKILNICNKELGTPFVRCSRVFENAIVDCNASLGPMFNWLCSLTYIVKSVCYLVKVFDLVCMIVDFISSSIIGVVIRKVKSFIRHIKTMFYVRIKFSHSFQFHTNTSKTLTEVSAGIVTEIKDRSRVIMVIFDFMTSAATIFFIFIIFRVCYYRYKFLTCERYDNKYITKNFIDIDFRRAKLEKETILPLNNREMTKYIKVGSKRLVKTEKRQLSQAAVTLGTATVKLATHMAADYALFWVLDLIRYYARFQSKVKAPNVPMVFVKGEGLLADLLQSVVKAFQPLGIELEIDTVPCLPNPIPPDYDRYIQIATLLVLCWFLTLLEPYGLRLRHTIMCYYHPTRAKQRAVWLYNHILRSRSSFLKFARRQLRRKVLGTKGITKVTCKEFLRDKIKFKIFRYCLGEDKQTTCLLCGEVFRESDETKPVYCQTPGCPGIYCQPCFKELKNLCTICLSPIDYGDLSDIDEEKDSSDEDPKKSKKKSLLKKKSKSDLNKSDDDSDDDDNDDDDNNNADNNNKNNDNNDGTNKDSDYSSDDYSFSYQYVKNPVDSKIPHVRRYSADDVEKQNIPDYATMDSFRKEAYDIKKTTQPKTDHLRSGADKLFIDQEPSQQMIDILPIRLFPSESFTEIDMENVPLLNEEPLAASTPKRKLAPTKTPQLVPKAETKQSVYKNNKPSRFASKQTVLKKNSLEEAVPLLQQNAVTSSSDTDNEELEGVLPKQLTYYNKRSTSPSYSSVDSDIKDSSHSIPKLNLSSLPEKSYPIRRTNRFTNIKYEVVSENSSTSSSKYSSVIDELQGNKRYHRNKQGTRKKNRSHDETSFGSMSSYEFTNLQKEKVSKYYKAVNNKANKNKSDLVEFDEYGKQKNKFMKLIQKFLPLRKRKSSSPQHEEEDIVLKSFNYSQEHWDTLSSDTSSPIYPFGPHSSGSVSSETSTPPEEGKQKRIRGGECNPSPYFSGPISLPKISLHQKLKPPILDNTTPVLPKKLKPAAPTRLNRNDLLSKYFVSIDDLTPTKDSNLLMNQFETTASKSANISREPPEKDPSTITLKKKSNILLGLKQEIQPDSVAVSDLQSSTSSGLSEDWCMNILGRPCPPKKFKAKPLVNDESIYHSAEGIVFDQRSKIKEESPLNFNIDKHSNQPSREIFNRSQLTRGDISDNIDNLARDSNKRFKNEEVVSNKNKKQLKDQGTNTNCECQVKSKRLQADGDHIDLFDRTFNNTSMDTESKDHQNLRRPSTDEPVERKNNSKMHYCKCNPERDTNDSNYKPCRCSTIPEPPVWESHRCCQCSPLISTPLSVCNETYNYNTVDLRNDNYGPNHENLGLPNFRDNSTQTYPTQYVQYTCNCGDSCDRPLQPPTSKMYKYPSHKQFCECNSSSSYISEDAGCNCYYDENPFSDLPYQNNEEYMDLVHELEDTLVTRNRNRVRRAMAEFEKRSRCNKPLDKPIINYDEPSESEEPILQKLSTLQNKMKNCGDKNCKCNNESRGYRYSPENNSQKGYVQQVVQRIKPIAKERSPRCKPNCKTKSHWQMNPRTGEWFKVGEYCYRHMQCPSRLATPRFDKDDADCFDSSDFCHCRCNNSPRTPKS